MECLNEVEILKRNCRCCYRFLDNLKESMTFVTHQMKTIFLDLMNEELDDGLICGGCSDHLLKFERFRAEIKWNRQAQLENINQNLKSVPNNFEIEELEENIAEGNIDENLTLSLSFDNNSCRKHDSLEENRSNLVQILQSEHKKRRDGQSIQVVTTSNISPKSICPQCGKAITVKALATHLKRHKTNRERQFLCELCSKTYLNKYELVIHQRNHLNIRPFECDIDGKTFTSKNNLNKHIQSQHLNQRRTVDLKVFCSICEKLFPFQSKMIEHFKKSHPDGNDDGVKVNRKTNHFHCKKCKGEFLTKFRIDHHVCLGRSKESLESNQCPVCSLVCQSRIELLKHFQDHGEKLKEKNKWRCKICKVIVNDKIAVHIENTHSVGSVNCNLCNKSLKNRKSLRQHLFLSHQNGYEIRKSRKNAVNVTSFQGMHRKE